MKLKWIVFSVLANALLLVSPAIVKAHATAPGASVASFAQDHDDWDKPPQEFRDAQRKGFHDGVDAARKDFDHHRRADEMCIRDRELVVKLEPLVLSFARKSGENGQLFGSVTSVDIAAGLEAKGFEVDRRKIQLAEPLKSLGDFTVAIKLHREVTAHVKVQVLAEAQEETPAAEPVAEEAVAE